MKFMKQSTLSRKTFSAPRQATTSVKSRGPVLKVQKKSHAQALQLSHRKINTEETEDHHLDFVMKPEIDPNRAALIIQTCFREWRFKKFHVKLERKQNAGKKKNKGNKSNKSKTPWADHPKSSGGKSIEQMATKI